MITGLTNFLREKKDAIVKKVRYNVVHQECGYSEYTRWMETVSFDEMETVDFEALLEAIDEFEQTFKDKR